MRASRSTVTLAAAAMLATFVIGAAAYVRFGDVGPPPGDAVYSYVPTAVNLITGRGYVLAGEFTDRYPPGFPLFIAAVFRAGGTPDLDNALYRWVILGVNALTVGVVFLLAREWLTPRPALLGSLALAFNPVFIGLGATRYAWNATPLFLLCFVLSLWWLARGRRAPRLTTFAAGGLARGLAVLVWPGASWLWVVDAVFIARALRGRASRVRHVLAFLAGLACVIGPWLVTAHAHTGRWALSSGLYPSMLDGVTMPAGPVLPEAPGFTARASAAAAAGALPETRDIAQFYVGELTAHPLDTFVFLAHKTGRAWYASIGGARDRLVFWSQVPLWLLGLYGAVRAWRDHRAMAVYACAVIAYCWIVSLGVVSVVRYMMPAVVLLSLFAGLGADALLARLPARRGPSPLAPEPGASPAASH